MNPDKPCDVQFIEHLMDKLRPLHKNNCWQLGGLYRWLTTYPDQIHEAVERLKSFFAEHGDIPQELIEIDRAFIKLADLEATNFCGLMDLNKWLETYPDIIFTNTERLDFKLDEMFPQMVIEVSHGDVYAHHHQTA